MISLDVLLKNGQERTEEINVFIQAGVDDKNEQLVEVAKSIS